MKLATHLALGVTLTTSAVMLNGCSSAGHTSTPSTTGPSLNAQARRDADGQYRSYDPARRQAEWDDLAYGESGYNDPNFADGGSDIPRPDLPLTPPPSARRDNDPHASLIGLYGELVSQSPYAAAQGDGAGNMSQVSFAAEGACFNPDVDRTGRKLIFSSTMHRPTADIYWKRPQGQTLHQLTSDPANDIMPTFSNDGWIAFASDRSGNWDIYLMPEEGGQTIQVTRDSDPELHPTFSPDGKLIAYCKMCTQSGKWEIWLIDLANSGTPRFLTYGLFPQWCPDVASNKILFQRARQRGSRYHSIWTIDHLNGEAKNPTEIVSAANAAVINPAWSPDGQKIVFVTEVNPGRKQGERPEQSDLWVINIDGTGRTALTSGRFANFEPVWSSDGSVYFVSNRSGIDNIWAKAAGGNLRFDEPTPKTGIASVPTDRQR